MEQFTSYGGDAESISICLNKAECDIAKIMSDIKEVQPHFIFEILNDNPAEPVTTIIRCNIDSESDAIDFLKALEEVTCTQWIVKGEIKNPQRVVYHKYWVCQHSKRNKKTLEQTPRNTCCEAKLDILIKKCNRNTSRNDPYLRRKPPLCGKLCITNTHNHPINTSGALKYLRITPETQENFIQYFEDGMGCSEAHRLHESILLNKNNSLELLANGAINPTRNCLSHLYKTWRDKTFGSLMAPLEKVKEKALLYESQGITILLREEPPWAVLVLTPIMKRAQMLHSSREIIFCDSTSSCDTMETTITILLTATKAGAVPIALLLHEGQSAESYIAAFGLLKNYSLECFGGAQTPAVFMTDDSAAEKMALNNIWPSSSQLLCHFHVAQKEWRWLTDSKNQVPVEKRQFLMKLFRAIMYARTEEDLDVAIKNVHDLSNEYPLFVKRFNAFFQRKNEWVTMYRNSLITRGNNTNNYAEVSIRILKDIVLCRTRAYNVTALIDFACKVWEEYFTNKLLEHAHVRKDSIQSSYRKLCSKMPSINDSEVTNLGNGLFSIPNSSKNGLYLVDINMGLCDCTAGNTGAFCKHQAWLHKHLNIAFPNAPAVSVIERFELGKLALGSKCPPPNWFLSLKDEVDVQMSVIENNSIGNSIEIDNNSDFSRSSQLNVAEEFGEEESHLVKNTINAEFRRLENLSDSVPIAIRKKFVKKLKTIKNAQQLTSFMVKCNHISSVGKSRGKIKVQPTSISRRRPGLTRGSGRVPSGRPAKTRRVNRVKKRPHSLSSNVNKNQMNAIYHG